MDVTSLHPPDPKSFLTMGGGLTAGLDCDVARGTRLVLTRGPAQVDRLLDLTGLTGRFEILDADGG